MQLTHLLTAIFAVAASAANFINFEDKTCQLADETWVPLKAEQQQDIVRQNYPKGRVVTDAGRFFSASERQKCPPNNQDTYRWVDIEPWQQPGNSRGQGGAIAVVYYDDTDTYAACVYLAAVQASGYAGICK